MTPNYSLKVVKVRRETPEVVTLCFKQPALKKIKYKAGQYLSLIFRINGRRYVRPYSFSSAPEIEDTLNVTIKRMPNGVVSNHIIDKVKENDVIEVLPPMGDFTLDNISNGIENKRIILWGSGSGITPLISIVKFALEKTNCRHVTLVYGNRSFETTIFLEQINELKARFFDRFSVWHFHTTAVVDEIERPGIIQGRINPKTVLSVIEKEEQITDTIHYICGPVGLKESVKHELVNKGIKNTNIFSEEFELSIDSSALENITTQNVTVNFKNQPIVFEVTKGKSILEAGLDAMLELPYSCQTGECVSCKAELIKGKIKTIGIEKLPAGLRGNEYLLCCSFPQSDDVELLITDI